MKKRILVLAIVLRLLVAGLLFHPDIKTINFQTSFLKKGVVNIYPYLIENKKTLTLKEEFVYFPLTYFTVGGYQAIISSLLGNGFDSWVSDAGANSVVNNPQIFKYLVLIKLPFLFLDIAIGFLLMNFFKDKKKKQKALTFWLFNPFTIILIYAFSNIDLYSVLFTVIAFLLIKQKKLLKASALLGIAASFKLYPLLFILFLVLKGKNVKEKVLIGVIPLLVLGAVIVPFWSPAFVQSALVSGLTTRIFSPGIPIGFSESIIIGFLLLSILFFYGWLVNKKFNLFNFWIILLLIIFSFSHFHITWLLWLAPFLVIKAIQRPKLAWPLFLWGLTALTIPLLYSDRYMTISLFRIYSTWYDLLPTPFTVIQKVYSPYNLQSIMHSALAGATVVISYMLLKVNKVKEGTKRQ